MKDIVQRGARYRVGNGESISITSDPWLIDDENPWVTSIHPVLCGAKVASLLQVGRLAWDEELLRDIFNARDLSCILNIPLCANNVIDQWFWRFEASGVFLC